MASTEQKKVIKGGCHCGHIKYEFDLPTPPDGKPLQGTRCNCSFCTKLATTSFTVSPDNFRLLSPDSLDSVKSYAPRVKTFKRYFCENCSAVCFLGGYYEHDGKRHDMFEINLSSVDQPQDGIDLSQVKIQYYDMLHDNFSAGKRDEPYEGGLV